MNQLEKTYTTDYNEWFEKRTEESARLHKEAGGLGIHIVLPLPPKFKVKGYALHHTVADDDGTHYVKTRSVPEGDSIMNYDFSECYILEYSLNYTEMPSVCPDTFDVDWNDWKVSTKRMIRYSGEVIPSNSTLEENK